MNACKATPIKENTQTNALLMSNWEDRLDVMGSAASQAELKAHLELAPDPEAASVQYLRGYLAGRIA